MELKFGEVSILSNSYSALCGEGENCVEQLEDETEIMEQNKDETNKATVSENKKENNEEEAANEVNMTIGIQSRRGKGTRQYLLRNSKETSKPTQNISAITARDTPRDQSKRQPPKQF